MYPTKYTPFTPKEKKAMILIMLVSVFLAIIFPVFLAVSVFCGWLLLCVLISDSYHNDKSNTMRYDKRSEEAMDYNTSLARHFAIAVCILCAVLVLITFIVCL